MTEQELARVAAAMLAGKNIVHHVDALPGVCKLCGRLISRETLGHGAGELWTPIRARDRIGSAFDVFSMCDGSPYIP